MDNSREASSPIIWPPIIYGSAAVICGVLSWIAGWPFETIDTRMYGLVAGVIVATLGVLALLMAGNRFNAAGTPIPPNQPTQALVFEGDYKATRNPMYLGFTLLLLGLGLAFDQLWFVIAVPLAMFAVTKLAIEREEAYLERKFGAEYLAYKQRVRRWI